jgi:hypothetical protein
VRESEKETQQTEVRTSACGGALPLSLLLLFPVSPASVEGSFAISLFSASISIANMAKHELRLPTTEAINSVALAFVNESSTKNLKLIINPSTYSSFLHP